MSNAVTAVGDAARTVVNTVVDTSEKLEDTTLHMAGSVIDGAANMGANVANKVVDAVPLPDSVKQAVHSQINFSKGVVEGAVDGVEGLVKGVTHLAGAAVKEGAALATSEQAREDAAETVLHGAEAVANFETEMVTDPSKALDDAESAAKSAKDKIVQIGTAVYHSYEEAKAAGHGDEWVGKAVGEVGVQIAGAVLTDGAFGGGRGCGADRRRLDGGRGGR